MACLRVRQTPIMKWKLRRFVAAIKSTAADLHFLGKAVTTCRASAGGSYGGLLQLSHAKPPAASGWKIE